MRCFSSQRRQNVPSAAICRTSDHLQPDRSPLKPLDRSDRGAKLKSMQQHDELDLRDEHLRTLTIEQLRDYETLLGDRRASISIQLMTANEMREHGGVVDEEWFRRACGAKAHAKRNHRNVEREISRRMAPARAEPVRTRVVAKLEELLANYSGDVRRDTVQRCIDAVLEVEVA